MFFLSREHSNPSLNSAQRKRSLETEDRSKPSNRNRVDLACYQASGEKTPTRHLVVQVTFQKSRSHERHSSRNRENDEHRFFMSVIFSPAWVLADLKIKPKLLKNFLKIFENFLKILDLLETVFVYFLKNILCFSFF